MNQFLRVMKKRILLLMFILAAIFTGCSNDDDQTESSDLNGTWKLVNFTAFIETIPEIQDNEVIWTFELESNQLHVVNNSPEGDAFIYTSGNYDLQVYQDSLRIDSRKFDYQIDADSLILSDNPELDGPRLKFIRN